MTGILFHLSIANQFSTRLNRVERETMALPMPAREPRSPWDQATMERNL